MIYLSRHQRGRSGLGEIVSLKVKPLCSCQMARLDLAGPEHGKCRGMKLCRDCRKVKRQSAFYPNGLGGRHSRCKPCYSLENNAQKRRRRIRNPEWRKRDQARCRAEYRRNRDVYLLKERHRHALGRRKDEGAR